MKAVMLGGALTMTFTDADARQPQRTPSKSPPASTVTSTNQRNGITAGYVNQLTQNVLPTLVRGPQLAELKKIFVNFFNAAHCDYFNTEFLAGQSFLIVFGNDDFFKS